MFIAWAAAHFMKRDGVKARGTHASLKCSGQAAALATSLAAARRQRLTADKTF